MFSALIAPMEETAAHSHDLAQNSDSEGKHERRVMISRPRPVRRQREGGELVCGTASAWTDRQSRPAKTVCQETTTPERSVSALVLRLACLLAKRGDFEELVVSSPLPLLQRTEEGEGLVCGTELSLEWSTCAWVLSVESLSVKGVECGKLAVCSPSPASQITDEKEKFVCGTELTGRQNSAPQAESTWSEAGEEQGGEEQQGLVARSPV